MFFSNIFSISFIFFGSDPKSKCQSSHNNQVLISVVKENRNEKRMSFNEDHLCEYH